MKKGAHVAERLWDLSHGSQVVVKAGEHVEDEPVSLEDKSGRKGGR